jgi:class 3 adenylate cyclase/tetratricopeptide (TPR) repeat protein
MSADRRHLTILCCDIVNSTRYAGEMDPEDFESLLSTFYTVCKTTVEAHRGVFAHHTGDGFSAYFGAPGTQGRNAQEAITCGRAVVEALARQAYPDPTKMQVRIGIATGLVVLSTVNHHNNESKLFAVGAPIHLAARIQSVAPAGTVCVDKTTRALAHRNFEFTDLGTHALKGFAENVQVWEAGNARPVNFRFEERQEHPSQFVGRAREMQVLERLWQLARQGQGQAAFITGEPGIGKSRLVFETTHRLVPGGPVFVFQCLEDHENDPLHPWTNYMRQAAGVLPNQEVEERRQRIEGFFDQWFKGLDWLRSFVVSLVAQDNHGLSLEDESNPARKLDAFRAAIVDSLDAPERDDPRIIIIEDEHWIDPSSEQILQAMVARSAGSRQLLLCTSRKKLVFDPAPHVTQLPIDRLTSMEAIKLAGQVIGRTAGSESILAHVVEHSDGIPLYIEEMAHAASNAGAMPVSDHAAAHKERFVVEEALPIPDTLQGTLIARLDSLGAAKEVAQMASVIGREFDFEVLEKLAARPGDALERDLTMMVGSGLVRTMKSDTETRYEFKHALIRDAAYNSLLKRDAVNLHVALARIYEEHYPDMRNSRPEILAQHLTASGRLAEAASLWLEAGIAANEIGSSIESAARFDRCLHCLESIEASTEALRIRMRCQFARGVLINDRFGPVNQVAHQALAEAVHLAGTVKDSALLVEALIRLCIVKYNSGDFSAAGQVAGQLLSFGQQNANARAAAIGMVSTGMCSFAIGQFAEARSCLEEALGLLDRGDERADAYEGMALAYLALTAHILGSTDEASHLCALAVKQARGCNASALATALGNSLYLHCMRGDVGQVRRTCEELVRLAQEKDLLMWYHQARFFLGWVSALGGDHRGLEMMEASLDRFREAGEMVEQSFFYGVLGERYLAAQMPRQALENIEQGLKLVAELGERFFEVPLLRLKAKCLGLDAASPAANEVAGLLTRAEQLVHEQGAVAWG